MKKGLILSSFAALSIALASTVFADQNEGPSVPKEVKDPVSDPAKQAKTEEMLKEEAKALSGDQGGEVPSEVKTPTPDAEAQAKTEKMLKDEKDALQGK
jgi:hypothetical protein